MGIIDIIKSKIKKDILNFEKIGIKNDWGINKNNITDYLIEPKLEEYIDSSSNVRITLWTVLEEKGKNGYIIVYSEENEEFGLAIMDKNNEKIFLGIYGSFAETLYSM